MKKITTKDLKQIAADRAALIESLNAAADDAAANAADLGEQAEAAARAGDVDGYMRFKAQADRAAVEAHVKRTQAAAAPNQFTRDEVIDAWGAYMNDYRKTFMPLVEKYTADRAALRDLFYRMVEMQCEALNLREYSARLLNADMTTEYANADAGFQALPMPFIPESLTGHAGPVASQFFCEDRTLYGERYRLDSIVHHHKPPVHISDAEAQALTRQKFRRS